MSVDFGLYEYFWLFTVFADCGDCQVVLCNLILYLEMLLLFLMPFDGECSNQ